MISNLKTSILQNLKIKKYLRIIYIIGRICSDHFGPECFRDTRHLCLPGKPPVLKLKDDAIPTEKLAGETFSSGMI